MAANLIRSAHSTLSSWIRWAMSKEKRVPRSAVSAVQGLCKQLAGAIARERSNLGLMVPQEVTYDLHVRTSVLKSMFFKLFVVCRRELSIFIILYIVVNPKLRVIVLNKCSNSLVG